MTATQIHPTTTSTPNLEKSLSIGFTLARDQYCYLLRVALGKQEIQHSPNRVSVTPFNATGRMLLRYEKDSVASVTLNNGKIYHFNFLRGSSAAMLAHKQKVKKDNGLGLISEVTLSLSPAGCFELAISVGHANESMSFDYKADKKPRINVSLVRLYENGSPQRDLVVRNKPTDDLRSLMDNSY